MRKHFLLLLVCGFMISPNALAQLTVPAEGGNKRAEVAEQIGLTKVAIHYNRPGVKGREGKIWGQLVPFGYNDLGFGTSKAAPWRAGANENTTISFSTDVKIEGKTLAAGTYALFMALQENETTLIFSKNTTSWGSYFYDIQEDALRVSIKQIKDQPLVERLKFEFLDQTTTSATVTLLWERWAIPFKVEVDLIQTQIASFRNELRGEKGFSSQVFNQAAEFCLQNNTNLDEALRWANESIVGAYIGEKNFKTLSTKANILTKLGKATDADATMKEALPLASMQDLHQYGRTLLNNKRPQDALAVFQMNAQKNPNVFTTNTGLCRGYSAVGDFKNALKYAKMALTQAPDANNKSSIEKMIQTLEQGKDVN